MNSLVVAGVVIRQDADGRYCLNDLHRAAGGQANRRPGSWLRSKMTTDLIEEAGGAQICAAVINGDGGGTYVCKELVYAYAMWISSKFHLTVTMSPSTSHVHRCSWPSISH